MSRLPYSDITAKSMELVTLAVPANTGDGSTVDALKGVKTYDLKVVSWEIVENAAPIEVSRVKEMTAPKLTRAKDLGFAPPVSRFALSELFLRSTTTAAVAAVLVLYLGPEDVDDRL